MPSQPAQTNAPTEEAPEEGCIAIVEVPSFLAEHWVEDGVHVVRSPEFDIIAGDEDFERAVDQFAEKAEELWGYLSELEGPTENEQETLVALASRFHRIYRELERREEKRRRRLISVAFPRRGHVRDWRPSTPRRSSQPSPA
jgi:hypothetical protein